MCKQTVTIQAHDLTIIIATTSPTIGWARQTAAPLKFDPMPSEAAYSAVSSNFEKCPQEVADDVLSSVAVEQVGIDVHIIFGDSMLNSGQIIDSLPS